MESIFEQYKSLSNRYQELGNDYQKLQEKQRQVEKYVTELEAKLTNLEKDYQKLVFAKAIGLTEQQKKDNHLMLSRLIAEIDKCLKLLKESNL